MNNIEQFSNLARYAAAGVKGTLRNMNRFIRATFYNHIHHIKFSFENAEGKYSFIDLAVAAMAALVHLSPDVAPEEFADQMTDTYRRKNADYGDSFSRSLDKYGIVAALVRISDKVNRLESLTVNRQEAQVKDESVQDTLLDLASYAIMSEMWMTEQIDKELKKTEQ